MRVAIRTPVGPSEAQPERRHAAGLPEDRPADDALTEPRAATRWASSPLLRDTSPLTSGQRWTELRGTSAGRLR